jgi:hypothetical protein
MRKRSAVERTQPVSCAWHFDPNHAARDIEVISMRARTPAERLLWLVAAVALVGLGANLWTGHYWLLLLNAATMIVCALALLAAGRQPPQR